jgi:hypothetical protein
LIRLTVYEIQQEQQQLLPRAERLMYQVPAERLVLSYADAAQVERRSYRPGEHVKLRVKSLNENNDPERCYLLAAAVDERVLPPGSETDEGPPAFFYLASEVPSGADLDNADFLVRDTPQARAALDLFLGTEGWRRFREPEQAGATERPAVFSRDNFDEVAGLVKKQVTLVGDELRRKALQERTALQEERSQKTAARAAAVAALADFRELPWRTARLGLAVLVLVFLAAGGLLLLIGLVRTLRGKRATVVLGGAFASLLLCLVVYGVSGELRVHDEGSSSADRRAELPARQLPAFPERAAAPFRDLRTGQRSEPVGRFTEAAEGRGGQERNSLQQQLALTRSREILREQQLLYRANEGTQANVPEPQTRPTEPPQGGKGPTTRAMEKASPGAAPTPAAPPAPARADRPASPAPQAALPLNAADVAKKRTSDARPTAKGALQSMAPSQLSLREYANRAANPPGTLPPDTILWYPALIAENGTALIDLDLPGLPTTYRLLLYGHSNSGRLGAYQGKLATQAK